MEVPERTVDGAASVYLQRLNRLVDQGVALSEARALSMNAALVWLDEHADREKWRPVVKQAVDKLLASMAPTRVANARVVS